MIKNIIITFTAIFCFTVYPVHANDRGIEGVGGTFKVMKNEHPSIGMVSETIFMDIYPNYYDVKAEFTFQNFSNFPVNVKMGFPENSHGDINFESLKKTSGFLKFKTSVDGQRLKVSKREIISQNEGSFQAHWIKEVNFKPLQKRKVKVEYRSKTGSIALPGIFTEYEFTGGNWKGKVKESSLKAKLNLPSDYSVFYGDGATPNDVVRKGNMLYFSRKNWEAEYVLPIMFIKKNN